jgi:hypothetical protein
VLSLGMSTCIEGWMLLLLLLLLPRLPLTCIDVR